MILRPLALKMVLESVDPLPEMEILGLGLREPDGVFGQSQDMGEVAPGEMPTGKLWLQGLAFGMLEWCIDIDVFEMYELDREVDTEGDTRRGIPRGCPSRRLKAILFCPPGT
jgi:hypothetical protein